MLMLMFVPDAYLSILGLLFKCKWHVRKREPVCNVEKQILFLREAKHHIRQGGCGCSMFVFSWWWAWNSCRRESLFHEMTDDIVSTLCEPLSQCWPWTLETLKYVLELCSNMWFGYTFECYFFFQRSLHGADGMRRTSFVFSCRTGQLCLRWTGCRMWWFTLKWVSKFMRKKRVHLSCSDCPTFWMIEEEFWVHKKSCQIFFQCLGPNKTLGSYDWPRKDGKGHEIPNWRRNVVEHHEAILAMRNI